MRRLLSDFLFAAAILVGHIVACPLSGNEEQILLSPGTCFGVQGLRQCVVTALNHVDADKRLIDARNDTYTDARMGEKIQFEEMPAMIAYAINSDEVQHLVRCAKQTGYRAVPRTGGHQLVIDLTHINHVHVSEDRTTARVGAGIRLGALYTALDKHDTTFAGGVCPTVGLAGLVSAGGYGSHHRALGMAAEHVLAIRMVTADGEILTASPTSHEELFWALRGGGGGTYGIMVEMELRLTQIGPSAAAVMTWDGRDVQLDILQRFLDWASKQTFRLTPTVDLYWDRMVFQGWLLAGTERELRHLIEESGLMKLGKPTVHVAGNCSIMNSRAFGFLIERCDSGEKVSRQVANVVPGPFEQFQDYPQYRYLDIPLDLSVPPAEPWPRKRRMTKSFIILKNRPLPHASLRKIVGMVRELDKESHVWAEWHVWNMTNDSPGHEFSFPWKEQASYLLSIQAQGSSDIRTQKRYEKWFVELEDYLRPIIGSASYSGYMDNTMSTNPLESYYGHNLCRLANIKQKYDPTNYFTNPLSITPGICEDNSDAS